MGVLNEKRCKKVAGNPGLQKSEGFPAPYPIQPFGQDKSLPYFITVYLYEKSVNLSWVLGG
jgi:hypothetical protein